MSTRKHFTFSGIVESVQFNLVTTAVFLPHHVIIELPKGRVKASGIINGIPFSSSVLYRRDTGRFFSISSALREAANIEPGDAVNVTFRIIEAEKVEVPEERETVLDEDDKAKKVWRMTSRQDVLASYFHSAKQIDMRMRNAFERVEKAKAQRQQSEDTPSKKKKAN